MGRIDFQQAKYAMGRNIENSNFFRHAMGRIIVLQLKCAMDRQH